MKTNGIRLGNCYCVVLTKLKVTEGFLFNHFAELIIICLQERSSRATQDAYMDVSGRTTH